MKLLSPLVLLVFGSACLCPLKAEETIIDSRFETIQLNPDPLPAPATTAELPLKIPTRLAAPNPASVTAGKEAIGDMKPPYLLVRVQPDETVPDVASYINMQWDLSQLPCEPGRYHLLFRIAVIDPAGSPGRFRIVLLNGEGKPLEGHPAAIPPLVGFDPAKFLPGEPVNVDLVLDTKQLTWGATANGAPLIEELPFVPEFLNQLKDGTRIARVEYAVEAGLGDKPGAELAIGNVVFKKE